MAEFVKKVICAYCGESLVPLKDWNKRCVRCAPGGIPIMYEGKAIPDEPSTRLDSQHGRARHVAVLGRDPAAIIETENGARVFVDKFGKDVDNPGYDLENDHHGRDFTTNRQKWEGKTIL